MMVLFWQPLKMYWWSLFNTSWEFWASSMTLETSMPLATGATWTKWPPYAGSSRTSPTLEATLIASPLLDSSMVPSWKVEWPYCLTSSPAHLKMSPQ
uniref:Uncharacterized protein n=1 Tax=Marmota marmota marmota TaxID=9994 RepID=A0A8C5Z6A1_MARMA